MRRRTISIGAPQQVHSHCGRGVGTSALAGCLNSSNSNSEISKLGGDVGQMVSPAVADALAAARAGKGG